MLKTHETFMNQNSSLIIQVLPMVKEQSQNKRQRKKKENIERQT